jgi:tape measure domain-containing protein
MSMQHAISGLTDYVNELAAAGIEAPGLTAMRNQIDMADSSVRVLNDNMQQVADGISNSTIAQDNFNAQLRESRAASGGLLGNITRMAAAYASIRTVKNILNLSDELTQTTARLDLVNDGLRTTEELQNAIYQSAQRSRAAYNDTAATVSRLGLLAGKAFSSNDEMIAFTEQMNKNFVIGGASIQEQTSAMYQLSQAMAAGKLQGDEYRSIIENAPLLANAIESYMQNAGVEGTMKDWASQGLLTAEVIKNALFSVADETNKRFENMSYTWAQVWQGITNTLLNTLQPLLQAIGDAAGWVQENWSKVEPVLYGVGAAVLGLAAAWGIQTAAAWIATGAAKAFFATLLTNPLTWIAVGVGVVVGLIYRWVQSVGGLRAAWLTVCNAVLTALTNLKTNFFRDIYSMQDIWDGFKLRMKETGNDIANFIGDMRTNVLMILQDMVNRSINVINFFISALNKIPGVNIDLIGQLTFGTTAQLENEAAKQTRLNDLAAYRDEVNANIAGREASLNAMKYQNGIAEFERRHEIMLARNAQGAAETVPGFDYDGMIGDYPAQIAANTSKQLDYSEEDLKLWRDIAERDTINRFTTAEVSVSFGDVNNNVSSNVDLDGISDYIAEKTAEALLVTAAGVHF